MRCAKNLLLRSFAAVEEKKFSPLRQLQRDAGDISRSCGRSRTRT